MAGPRVCACEESGDKLKYRERGEKKEQTCVSLSACVLSLCVREQETASQVFKAGTVAER